MPLEPPIRVLFALINRLGSGSSSTPMPLQRQAASTVGKVFARVVVRPGRGVESISHEMVPVHGGHILVRLYRPQEGTLPLHVFLHGGGFCTGTLDQRDQRCQELAAEAGCVVASVDYRLAPENQYPTAPEDCYAALCWLVEHADPLGIAPGAVSIGGESAGANLATVACLMARDRGGPPLVFQLLEVPTTDLTMSQPSITQLASGYGLTRQGMEAYVASYIGDSERVREPYASPLFADLQGLPPAWVLTCEFDPLRSEGEAYAQRLADAGVPTEHRALLGHTHGSFAFTRLTASARQYQRDAAAALRAAHRSALQVASPSSP
jgi:acetyl esterase